MITRLLNKNLLICLLLAAMVMPGLAQNQRLASVDLKKLFEKYWKTQQANNNLQAQREDMLKERNAITNMLVKADGEYKKLLEGASDQAVSAEEREKKKKDAENKLLELRQMESRLEQFVRNAATTLQETENRMRNNIVKELRESISAKSKTAGYALVIDSSADTPVQTPVFLFSNLEDITEVLITELNAKAPRGFLDEKPREKAASPETKK